MTRLFINILQELLWKAKQEAYTHFYISLATWTAVKVYPNKGTSPMRSTIQKLQKYSMSQFKFDRFGQGMFFNNSAVAGIEVTTNMSQSLLSLALVVACTYISNHILDSLCLLLPLENQLTDSPSVRTTEELGRNCTECPSIIITIQYLLLEIERVGCALELFGGWLLTLDAAPPFAIRHCWVAGNSNNDTVHLCCHCREVLSKKGVIKTRYQSLPTRFSTTIEARRLWHLVAYEI